MIIDAKISDSSRLVQAQAKEPVMRNRVALLLAGVLLCSFTVRAQAPPSEGTSEVKKDEAKKDKEESSKPKPFAEVVKEAEAIQGMFSFYRTEDKVFMELLPNQFEKM